MEIFLYPCDEEIDEVVEKARRGRVNETNRQKALNSKRKKENKYL